MSNKKIMQKSYHFTKNELKHPEKLTGKRLIELLKNKRVPHSNYRRADLLKLVQLSKLSTAKLKDIVKNSGNKKYKTLLKNELISNALSAFSTTKLKRSHKKSLDALNKTEAKYKALTDEIMKKFPETKKFIEKKMEGHDNLIKTYSEDVQKVKDTLENAPEFKDLSGGGVAGTRPENEREYKKRIKREKLEKKNKNYWTEENLEFAKSFEENWKSFKYTFNIPVNVQYKDNTGIYWATLCYQCHTNKEAYTKKHLADAEEWAAAKIEDYLNTVIQTKVDIKNIRKFNDSTLVNIKYGFQNIQYKFLENAAFEKLCEDTNNENCMINFTVLQLAGKAGFKNFTSEVMKKQLGELQINYEEGITVDDYVSWIQYAYPNKLSFYAIDPLKKRVFKQYVKENLSEVEHRNHHTLCGLLNNKHIYPITDEVWVDKIRRTKKLPAFAEVDFYFSSDKYFYVNEPISMAFEKKEEEDDDDEIEDVNFTALVDGTIDKTKYDIILYNGDMKKLAMEIFNKHKCIGAMNWKKIELITFEHPISGQIIKKSCNYEESKEVCEVLYHKYDCYNFKFKNQSFTQVARELFKINFGGLPIKSMADTKTLEINDKYNTHPLIHTLVDNFVKDDKNCFGIDYKKSYSNAVRNMDCDYPIFAIFDEWVPFKKSNLNTAGEFLVDPFEIKSLGGIKFDRQILSYGLVNWLVEKKYITLDKLRYFKKASYVLDKKILADFVDKVYEIFPVDKNNYGKTLINSFIGWLGKKYNTKDIGAVTDDFDQVSALFNKFYAEEKNGNVDFNEVKFNDLYFVIMTERTRITNGDYTPIWRAIISQGMRNLLSLIDDVYDPACSRLIGYNTDSAFIQCPKICKLVKQVLTANHPIYKREDWKPKKYREFVYSDEYKDIYVPIGKWNKIPEVHYNGDKILIDGVESDRSYLDKLKNMSFMCNGIPGCQKTTLLKSLYNKDDSLAICFSNKACENLIKDKVEAYTFDSYFYSHSNIPEHIKRIQIDEYSMTPVHWIHILYDLKCKRPDLIIQLYGDYNQCPQVDNRYFEYIGKRVIRWLCDFNLMEKTYNELCGRYNKRLYYILAYLLDTGKLHPWLKSETVNKFPKLETNICYSNKTKDRINSEFVESFEDWRVGMKVICNQNFKKLNIYKSRVYYIHSIEEDNITLSDELNGPPRTIIRKGEDKECPITIRYTFFDPAYCVTCYKYQGATIEDDINIFDVEIMNLNQLYTSLSRCRKDTQIHLKYIDNIFKRQEESKTPTKIVLVNPEEKRNLIEFLPVNLGFIYQLDNNNNTVKESYIGLTRTTIDKRLQQHINKNPKIKNKIGKWTSTQLARFYYVDNKELERLETRFIYNYNGDFKLINEMKTRKDNFDKKISVGAVTIEDSKKFEIVPDEKNNRFRIRYTDVTGKEKSKTVRYGPKKSEARAFEEIVSIRQDLINENVYGIKKKTITLSFD